MEQLTIDGGAVPHERVLAGEVGLSQQQRAILRWIRAEGFVTTTQAGRLMHSMRVPRGCPDRGGEGWNLSGRAEGCCRFCASDGLGAMRRLLARELVDYFTPGIWTPRRKDDDDARV